MILDLLKHQRPDIDKKKLYGKDPFELNYSSTNEKKYGLKNKTPKAFIDYL